MAFVFSLALILCGVLSIVSLFGVAAMVMSPNEAWLVRPEYGAPKAALPRQFWDRAVWPAAASLVLAIFIGVGSRCL